MLKANTQSMEYHLDVISAGVITGKQAVLVVDKAAWHLTGKLEVPENMTIVPLSPYSPELNSVEQIWQLLRQRNLANRCFRDYQHIVDACCEACNKFVECPGNIQLFCTRKWVELT